MEDIDLTSTKFAQTKAPCPLSSLFIKYLPCSSAFPSSQSLHSTKATQRRPFYTKHKINGGPDGKHRRLVHTFLTGGIQM